MTKPHEETWTCSGGHRVETPGGKIEPTVNPPDREPAICALIAQAPAMARLLLRVKYQLLKKDRDIVDAVLRAAEVLT